MLNNSFQALDIWHLSNVITQGREMNEVSPMFVCFLCVGTFWNMVDGGESKRNMVDLSELRIQKSEFEKAKATEIWDLHRKIILDICTEIYLSFCLYTKMYMHRVKLHEVEQRKTTCQLQAEKFPELIHHFETCDSNQAKWRDITEHTRHQQKPQDGSRAKAALENNLLQTYPNKAYKPCL